MRARQLITWVGRHGWSSDGSVAGHDARYGEEGRGPAGTGRSARPAERRRYRSPDRRGRYRRRPEGQQRMNAVLLRGLNDDEGVALLAIRLGHGYELRFIEPMPPGRRSHVTPRGDGDRRRNPSHAARRVHAGRRPGHSGRLTGTRVARPGYTRVRRTARQGRRHCQLLSTVLRRLRPHPRHRRRSGPSLPVSATTRPACATLSATARLTNS